MKPAATIERLETPRMVCERMRSEHVPELLRLLLDPRVSRWLWPGGEPPTERDVVDLIGEKEVHWDRYGFGMWLMRDAATGKMVGRGGLQWTYVAELNEVEVGWAVVPERWGQGLATELARASVEVGFGTIGMREIVAFALPENAASRRVMERTGFAYERDIVHASLPHVLYRQSAPESPPGPLIG
jgi:[ribosomal protein S5]-alanine N-acetyltransferase